MPQVKQTAVMPYRPEDVYLLVNDIESYPDFLPWCSNATITAQDEDSLSATLALSLGSIKQVFTTRNMMQYGKRIDMRLVEGPFKHLYGYWLFSAADNEQCCHIELSLDYEFENSLIQYLVSGLLDKALHKMMDAFVNRLHNIRSD